MIGDPFVFRTTGNYLTPAQFAERRRNWQSRYIRKTHHNRRPDKENCKRRGPKPIKTGKPGEEAALRAFQDYCPLTTKELAEKIRVGKDTALFLINAMLESYKLVAIGTRHSKRVRYELAQPVLDEEMIKETEA